MQVVCEALSQKHPTQKRAHGVVQMIELHPTKCEALRSNPSAIKTKAKQKTTLN
jgi:hypothetical protein